MILNNCTYEEVLNLIINGHSYRYISETFGISTTTVFNTSKRFKKTGSPYPSLNQRPIYDPMIQEVQSFINDALCMRRVSHNIHKRKKCLSDALKQPFQKESALYDARKR